MVGTINRRRVLVAGGAAGAALGGCLTLAQEGNQGCVPPGQYECPEDYVLLAKHEFEDCTFTQEEGDCDIEITDFRSKDGEDCEPVEFDWEVTDPEDCEVYNIRVNGGGDCEDHEEDGATEGTVTTNLENEGGQRAAISNVIFCGDDSPGETPEETQDDTPEETPEDTPEETPEDTPEQTPEPTPTDDDGQKDKDPSGEEPC